MNNVRDQIALVLALGYRKTAMIVGHDQGSSIANYGVIARPDMFPRLTLLGSGADGGPSFPFNTANGAPAPHPAYSEAELAAAYAKLNPPRKGYQDYWATKQADDDMKHEWNAIVRPDRHDRTLYGLIPELDCARRSQRASQKTKRPLANP